MTPTFKEYVFDFEELKLLSVLCKKCKSEIILDVASEDFRTPNACPSCREEFSSSCTDALKRFSAAYSELGKNESKAASARIRIRREADVSEF